MEDEKKLKNALAVYETVISALDAREWTYDRDDDELVIRFGVQGEDIPMDFVIRVDAERQLLKLFSFLPFKVKEDKRVDLSLATNYINYTLINGNFDLDLSDGSLLFRVTTSFHGSLIGEDLIQYLISISLGTVDDYNDKFLAINSGFLSVEDFIKKEEEG